MPPMLGRTAGVFSELVHYLRPTTGLDGSLITGSA